MVQYSAWLVAGFLPDHGPPSCPSDGWQDPPTVVIAPRLSTFLVSSLAAPAHGQEFGLHLNQGTWMRPLHPALSCPPSHLLLGEQHVPKVAQLFSWGALKSAAEAWRLHHLPPPTLCAFSVSRKLRKEGRLFPSL